MEQIEFLTTREVGRLLRLSARTVERMVRDGRLPGKKIGRQWCIKKADIENFLQEG